MTESFKVSQFIKPNAEMTHCFDSDSIEKAKTLMLLNDYSQLPVLNKNSKIEGGISWKSIGKSESIGKKGGNVNEYMEEPVIIKDSGDFLKYIKLVAKKDYVFVTNYKNELKGIITTYDMTLYFRDFITPFLKLGIIEDSIRRMITKNALKIPKDKDVNELVFSQYSTIFLDDYNWSKLNFPLIDQSVFIEKLNQIRLIRNKVAHYKPDPLKSSEHFVIESFTEIIKKVSK
tara:strand:- start:277 stop:969 length:693 start_codon:yes stop_codon:yes gene_type:complete